MASAAGGLNGTILSLAPLAEHADHPAGQVHVLQIQSHQFAEAQAGGVEELQDGPVAETERGRGIGRIEQRTHLVGGHVRRHAALHPRRGDERAGIGVEQPLATQIAREGADRGQLARGRRPGLPTLVDLGQVRPHQPVIEVVHPRLAPEPYGCERDELRQVAPVGAHGVAREVAVQAQEIQKRLKLLAHRIEYRSRAYRPSAGGHETPGPGGARPRSVTASSRRAVRARNPGRPHATPPGRRGRVAPPPGVAPAGRAAPR